MQPNGTMKILLNQTYIKVYTDNLNHTQRELLQTILAKTTCEVTLDVGAAIGYCCKGKQEKLYKLLYQLCNSFSIELI